MYLDFGKTKLLRVSSPAEGYYIPYLTRVVGAKKAREMWMLCRRYSAQEALQMGLVNVVVPLGVTSNQLYPDWFDSDEGKEGTQAFLEKRQPRFWQIRRAQIKLEEKK